MVFQRKPNWPGQDAMALKSCFAKTRHLHKSAVRPTLSGQLIKRCKVRLCAPVKLPLVNILLKCIDHVNAQECLLGLQCGSIARLYLYEAHVDKLMSPWKQHVRALFSKAIDNWVRTKECKQVNIFSSVFTAGNAYRTSSASHWGFLAAINYELLEKQCSLSCFCYDKSSTTQALYSMYFVQQRLHSRTTNRKIKGCHFTDSLANKYCQQEEL